jgi:adenosylhomocysteine nucleosidase
MYELRVLTSVLFLASCHAQPRPDGEAPRVVVLISASMEWKATSAHFDPTHPALNTSPWGEWFETRIHGSPVVLLHGGYGKVAAAGSTQWAIDRFHPDLLVNLGTCGGFEGFAQVGDVIAVDETIIYDIVELMGDASESIADYSTKLPMLWPEALRSKVRVAKMLSGDRDLDPAAIPALRARFQGIAGDWESGAIAYTAARNHTRTLILRAVTDVVHPHGDALYGQPGAFEAAAAREMERLFALLEDALPLLTRPEP